MGPSVGAERAEALLLRRHYWYFPRPQGEACLASPLVDRFAAIRAIVLDVDGVLTDGGVWWGPNGEEWKRFSFADIIGVSLARKAGLTVALVSGEDSTWIVSLRK